MDRSMKAVNELREAYVASNRMQYSESEIEKQKYAELEEAMDCVVKDAPVAEANKLHNAILDYASSAEQHGFEQGFNLALRLCLES